MTRDILAGLDLKALLSEIETLGRGGDTELVHVNKGEIEILRALGGSGTVNPDTGLFEFMDGGQGDGGGSDNGGGADDNGSDRGGMDGTGDAGTDGTTDGVAGADRDGVSSLASDGADSSDSDTNGYQGFSYEGRETLDPDPPSWEGPMSLEPLSQEQQEAVSRAINAGVFGGVSRVGHHDPGEARAALDALEQAGVTANEDTPANRAFASAVATMLGFTNLGGMISGLRGQSGWIAIANTLGITSLNPASMIGFAQAASQAASGKGFSFGMPSNPFGEGSPTSPSQASERNGEGTGTGNESAPGTGTGTGLAPANFSQLALNAKTGTGGGRPTSTGWGNALGRGGFITGRTDQYEVFRV